jgi:hypothetical protein
LVAGKDGIGSSACRFIKAAIQMPFDIRCSPDKLSGLVTFRHFRPMWLKWLMLCLKWRKSLQKPSERLTLFSHGRAMLETANSV